MLSATTHLVVCSAQSTARRTSRRSLSGSCRTCSTCAAGRRSSTDRRFRRRPPRRFRHRWYLAAACSVARRCGRCKRRSRQRHQATVTSHPENSYMTSPKRSRHTTKQLWQPRNVPKILSSLHVNRLTCASPGYDVTAQPDIALLAVSVTTLWYR